MKAKGGAYVLQLTVKRRFVQRIGALGEFAFDSGTYLYVGSARRSLENRTRRHRRLAAEKTGNLHWHIDYLLANRNVTLERILFVEGGSECAVAQSIALIEGISAPVRGFGSSDCTSHCEAHLFRLAPGQSTESIEKAIRQIYKA